MNEDELLDSYEEEQEESADLEYVEYTPSFFSTLLSTFWAALKIIIAVVMIAAFPYRGPGTGNHHCMDFHFQSSDRRGSCHHHRAYNFYI